MTGLKIAPFISLEVNDTGDVYANVMTPMGEFISTFAFDNMFMLNQKDIVGSKIYGLGNHHLVDASSIKSNAKLHFYFYYTDTTATLNNEGKIPSFMDSFLNIDESKLVAYACDVNVPDYTNTKQGITKEREGLMNTTSAITGCTMYFPEGYGTGEINAMCVSLVDLSTIKTTGDNKISVFAGVQFGLSDNYYGVKGDYGAIKPGTPGLTTDDEILLKIRGVRYLYNIKTGDMERYIDDFPTNFPFFGCNSVLLGDKLYFTHSFGRSAFCIYELGLTEKTRRNGGEIHSALGVGYLSSAIKIDDTVYLQTASDSSTIRLQQVNIETLRPDGSVKTITLPTHFSENTRDYPHLTQFPDGLYGVIDNKTGICYKFTNLDDVEGSIVDVYFTGSVNYPSTPIKNGDNIQFLSITESGFYSHRYASLAYKNSGYQKLILADGRYGPLISYNKFDTSYNKTVDSTLKSSFMITASSL